MTEPATLRGAVRGINRATRRDFLLEEHMHQYSKHILTIPDQVQSYIDAGMTIESISDAEKALAQIGSDSFSHEIPSFR